MKKDKMGKERGAYGGEEKCIPSFGGETCRTRTNLVFVLPCIMSIDGEEENQLDATITVY